jgi:excisionase family DNA binding protein
MTSGHEALSLQEAARLLSVHEDTLLNWFRRDPPVIRLIKVGPRLWRVPRSEILRLRKQNKAE